VQIVPEVRDQNGVTMAGASVAWTSSNSSIAQVSSTGLVSGLSVGSATITATAGAATSSVRVQMSSMIGTWTRGENALRVESSGRILVSNGGGVQGLLSPDIVATYTTMEGTVSITDTSGGTDGGCSPSVVGIYDYQVSATSLTLSVVNDSCPGRPSFLTAGEWTRLPSDVTTVEISPPALTISLLGETRQLTAVVLDQNGFSLEDQIVVWTSTDSTVATVSPSGLVTALRSGVTTVEATAEGVADSIRVTVTQVASVELTPDSVTMAALGESVTLMAVARNGAGEEVQGVAFTWISSDLDVATVSTGGVVTAVANGVVIVSAQAEGKLDTTVVTVDAPVVTSVSVSPDTLELLRIGADASLSAFATDQYGNPIPGVEFTWMSLDGSIATVNESGSVTAVRNGTTSIIAEVEGVADTATVIVAEPQVLTTVTVTPGTVRTFGGAELSAAGFDQFGEPMPGIAFTWSSSDASVATVSESGLVTAVGNGDVAITAAADERQASATVTVDLLSTLVVGAYHSCGIAGDGAAYCWGENSLGTVGDGTNFDRWTPRAVAGGLTFTALSGGHDHTCALTDTGVAYCWGGNALAQLGDGRSPPKVTPAPVAGGLTFGAITAGNQYSCSLTTTGQAYCWGGNEQGQLGDGTLEARDVPTPVGGGLTFTDIYAGELHTCGLVGAGEAYCWGYNGYRQLGDGTTTRRLVPTAVGGGLTFTSLSVGQYHTCGITPSEEAYCWGRNDTGAGGNGGTAQSLAAPTLVTGGHRFAEVSAGSLYSCGRTTAGAGYCWGYNADGGIGDGTNTQRLAPRAIAGGLSLIGIAASRAEFSRKNHTTSLESGFGRAWQLAPPRRSFPAGASSLMSERTLSSTCSVAAGGRRFEPALAPIGEVAASQSSRWVWGLACRGWTCPKVPNKHPNRRLSAPARCVPRRCVRELRCTPYQL
jgi:alpha-tubulin suppressor-like RCC1 family protein